MNLTASPVLLPRQARRARSITVLDSHEICVEVRSLWSVPAATPVPVPPLYSRAKPRFPAGKTTTPRPGPGVHGLRRASAGRPWQGARGRPRTAATVRHSPHPTRLAARIAAGERRRHTRRPRHLGNSQCAQRPNPRVEAKALAAASPTGDSVISLIEPTARHRTSVHNACTLAWELSGTRG